jgi:DNA polymerase-3 subunit delta
MYGPDTFSRRQVLEEIKNGLDEPDMLSVNTSLLDGQQLTPDQLQNICSAVPFLCPARFVVVDRLLERFEPRLGSTQRGNRSRQRSNLHLKEWESFGNYVSKEMPSTTILVLTDGKLTYRNTLLKFLTPLATVRTFPYLKSKELGNWIVKRVEEGGGTITPEAVELLIKLIGGDLWAMGNEVDKLLAYCSGRMTAEEDVKQLTCYYREVNIFQLVDSILYGRRKMAQQQLYRLFQEGVEPLNVLNLITRQLRLIVRVKELVGRMSRAQIQDKLGLQDYALDQILGQAREYEIERLKRAYHKVLESDIAIKTGKYEGNLAVDLLLLEI